MQNDLNPSRIRKLNHLHEPNQPDQLHQLIQPTISLNFVTAFSYPGLYPGVFYDDRDDIVRVYPV